MANRIRTSDPRGLNKGRGSKFSVGSRVRQTAEEDQRTYRPKRREYNNKDEDNSPKNLNDKNASGIFFKENFPLANFKKMLFQIHGFTLDY